MELRLDRDPRFRQHRAGGNMSPQLPRTIAEYLDQLRAALRSADPALIQDALYDAEDHLRSEMLENPGRSEAEVLAKIAASSGALEEGAGIYGDKEQQVQQALRAPPPPRRPTALRSEEHTSELQSHRYISYDVFFLEKQ